MSEKPIARLPMGKLYEEWCNFCGGGEVAVVLEGHYIPDTAICSKCYGKLKQQCEELNLGVGETKMTDPKPLVMRYQHDCSECKPLGQYQNYDLYFCDKGGATIIARYGESETEYTSGLRLAETSPPLKITSPPLKITKLMAVEAGFLKGD